MFNQCRMLDRPTTGPYYPAGESLDNQRPDIIHVSRRVPAWTEIGPRLAADRTPQLTNVDMVIAQISDTHILARSADETIGKHRADNLRRCVADINRRQPDVVVHTGDIVHQGRLDEYAHVREILGPLQAPLYVIPGNRDHRDSLRAIFDDHTYFPANGDFLHYTVENHAVRLVALDSIAAGEDAGDNKGAFCERRLAWLDNALAQAPDRPTILLIHQPPFDVGSHYVGGYRRPQQANDLAALVSRHPQVGRLLCGHIHRAHRAQWGGTVATTIPSVAVDLRKGDDAAIAVAPSYLLHAASSDGAVVSHTQVA